jgi:nitrate reductase gamma subunit
MCYKKNSLQTFVYGDLYRYDVEKNEWKLVSSPNSPPPRSAHQAIAWKNNIYMFGTLIFSSLFALNLVSIEFKYVIFCPTGGEFTSPNQERFHHYKVTLTPPSLFVLFFSHILFIIWPLSFINENGSCKSCCRIFGCLI